MKSLHLILACGLLAALPTKAALIYGLTCENNLISFDSANPGTVNFIGNISQPGIVDIDFFPVTNTLYGLTSNGNAYAIDITNANATFLSMPSGAVSPITDFDFNPETDLIRMYGQGDQNYRMMPHTSTPPNAVPPGTVLFDGPFNPASVALVANAYSNNVDGAVGTTLYSIDFMTDSLMVHSGDPQQSNVVAVGPLGIKLGSNVGFDIDPNGDAYMNDSNNLYAVNLANGQANLLGVVGDGVLAAIAVPVPEPGSALLAALGALVMFRRCRRRVQA